MAGARARARRSVGDEAEALSSPPSLSPLLPLSLAGAWYTYSSKKFLRQVARVRFKRGRDPLSGKVFYTNTMNHKVQFTQPLIIGKVGERSLSLRGTFRL